MWEEYGWFTQVAMYVRHLRVAENPKASASTRTLLLRQEDALGISIGGLRRNRWIIAADNLPAVEEEGRPARPMPRGASAKQRLEVIRGGA
jgi:hypothetical protein